MSFLSPITDFIKKYGVIGIILHIAISLFFLLAIFALLTYGIDLKATLRAVGINLDKYEWSRSMGQYAIIMGVWYKEASRATVPDAKIKESMKIVDDTLMKAGITVDDIEKVYDGIEYAI